MSGYPDRRDALIARDLPAEQFAALAKGTIPVTLEWRPPLYTDRFAQTGLVFLLLSMVAWLVIQVRGWVRQATGPEAAEVDRVSHTIGPICPGVRGSMRTDAERLQLMPTSPDTAWLFWITFCLDCSWPSSPHIGFGRRPSTDRQGWADSHLVRPLLHGCPIRPDGSALVRDDDPVLCEHARSRDQALPPCDASLPSCRSLLRVNRVGLRERCDERAGAAGLSGIRGDLRRRWIDG